MFNVALAVGITSRRGWLLESLSLEAKTLRKYV